MKYLTGILAFQIPCELNSRGLWNRSKKDFVNDELFTLAESENSRWKDWGIELNKLIPGREYALWNVANHVRAYLDMLVDKRFDELKGLFIEAIFDPKCRQDIFMASYGKLRHLADWQEYDSFMRSEFGNAWESYKDSVRSVSEHVKDSVESMNRWEAEVAALAQ